MEEKQKKDTEERIENETITEKKRQEKKDKIDKVRDFLKKKDFHQTLRNEILYGVAPRTLQSSVEQTNVVFGVMNSLRFGGFLRNEGFKQLGTMIEMSKVCNEELRFNFNACRIDTFCRSGRVVIR